MRVLIYSDVHGNLPAFETMLKDAGPCEQYICLGDLVNYGPWSNECVDLALSLPNATLLMGNHEEAFIAGTYPGENKLVQQFFSHTYKSFSRQKEVSKFQKNLLLDSFLCCHTIGDAYIYPDTIIELDGNYMIGHSHHQFHYSNSGFHLYNVGSVGQNRKHINVASYAVWDMEYNTITLASSIYDIDQVVQKMEADGYPENCLNYYRNKGKMSN